MNKFVLMVCFGFWVDLATATPDLSLGYHYNQGHSSGGSDFLQAPGGTISSSNPLAPIAASSSSQYFNAAPSFASNDYNGRYTNAIGSFGSGSGSNYYNNYNSLASANNLQFTSSSHPFSVNYEEQQAYLHQLHQHEAPIVTKHFYLHSAPVDHDEQQIVRYVNIGRPQKNYRVVFIDAPTSTASKAKIIANVAPVEDKTAIYVLSKKTSALDVSAEVVTPAPVEHKPEVFFIKYKTPEEARHAQHAIQTQYDALGGSSDIVNEGSAQVTSVIGSLGDHNQGFESSNGNFNAEATHSIGSSMATGDNTQQTYLPAHHK